MVNEGCCLAPDAGSLRICVELRDRILRHSELQETEGTAAGGIEIVGHGGSITGRRDLAKLRCR